MGKHEQHPLLLLCCTVSQLDQAVLCLAVLCRVNLHCKADDSSSGGAGLAIEPHVLSRLHAMDEVWQGRSS